MNCRNGSRESAGMSPTPGCEGDIEYHADRPYVWHPYSSVTADAPLFPVKSASGVRLTLEDGRELIDGMSSWWCAIHGYNHPEMNQAISAQLDSMSHVKQKVR